MSTEQRRRCCENNENSILPFYVQQGVYYEGTHELMFLFETIKSNLLPFFSTMFDKKARVLDETISP